MTKHNLKEALLRGAEIYDAEHRFDEKYRAQFMNASEAAGCIRRQWYAKKGALGDEQSWGYARRGSHMEEYMVDRLLRANVPLVDVLDKQRAFADKKLGISATSDGRIEWAEEDGTLRIVAVEFKSFDPRKNTSKFPTPAHVTQLQIGMELMRLEGIEVSEGVIMYQNASDYDDIHEIDVGRMPAAEWTRWQNRAKKILRSKSADNLDREGKRTGDCKYCPFTKVCGVKATGNGGGGRTRSNRGSNLDEAIRRFAVVKDEMEELKAQESELKEDIKSELHKRKTNETQVGDYLVRLTQVQGRASLDKKAVKAAGIDLSPFEKIGNPSERLTVERIATQ